MPTIDASKEPGKQHLQKAFMLATCIFKVWKLWSLNDRRFLHDVALNAVKGMVLGQFCPCLAFSLFLLMFHMFHLYF